ncbi:putative transmembrane GTPase FZO-like, chloroplastic [Vitis vinifera]|uniref:Putative transmembrane GTPase FZO-like, chloroplastic n=1 Tax=Vitis vinifera TaxID=29760 RepID=A0A438F488_VITVI|nr:putative transmembrane GTPase FZO-like, chloroplastic [Vitis vinifera]
MVSLLSQPPSIHPLFFIPTHHRYHHHSHRNHTHNHRYPLPLFSRRRSRLSIVSIANNSIPPTSQNKQPRTVYPGGYKRPEIRVPSLVLQLSVDEVLDRAGVLDVVDEAVSKWVGVVVLDGGDGSGGRLYEAACLLKSVVRERAYLMVAERVDIAAAVNANGVVLSDKGLRINLEKSELIPVGRVENLDDLLDELGCKMGSPPFSYLGLPLGAPFKYTVAWDGVEEQFHKRVVRLRLEQIQRNFVWGGGVLEHKPHLVNGVGFLRMREVPCGIELSMVGMRKQKGVSNSGGKRGVWGWVVENDKKGLGSCEI